MDYIEDLEKTAIVINLTETFEFLKKILTEQTGIIISPYPTINGLEIKFHKGIRCIQFKTGAFLNCEAPIRYQHIGYGFLKPFEIQTNENCFLVKYGIGTLTKSIGEDNSSKGELWELEEKIENESGYFRAIFPTNAYTKVPSDLMTGQHFKGLNSLRVAGYITFTIDDHQINFYDYTLNNNRYVFIECNNFISYFVFEKILEAVIYAFGFISGSLIRDEVITLRFKNSNFTNIEGFQFRKIEESIISSLELLNPIEHKQYENLKTIEYLSEIIFSKIVYHSYTDQRFLRTLRIITQSRDLPTEIQVASIFVALETVKEIVIETKKEKTNSFINEDFALKLIQELKEKIETIPEKEFNNKKRVLRKISEINSIGNNEGFFAAFELLGISLCREEKECISMRNRFLHGNIPFSNEPEEQRNKKLQAISLNAHILTCILILKYVNYVGAIKDFAQYLNQINNDKVIKKPIFRII